MTTLFQLLRRLGAFLYDLMLLFSVLFVVTGVIVYFNNLNAVESMGYRVILLLSSAMFFCWFWKHGGQTLGMRAWRIKLVNSKQTAITWTQCVTRFAAGLLTFGLTYIYALFDSNGRTLHDVLSRTKIISTKTDKN
jgi:uncharacterized RDD family membrane protein YckC